MEVAYQYSKKRADFGKHCAFNDMPSTIMESVPPSSEWDDVIAQRNPVFVTVDTNPVMAEHEVNTDRVNHKNQGMRHFEGGWPENVDGTEAEQVDRYLKKANKDTKFKTTVQGLGASIDGAIKQNNSVDIYEEYFEGIELDLSSEPPSARGASVFRDPSPVKRTATAINWHPEGSRLAVAYSILKFQDERILGSRLAPQAYIWDVANPNFPMVELAAPSPLVSLRYNVKTPDILVGGSYNGLVTVFDVKKPRAVAISSSSIDKSHHDPVYDVFWIQSKTNTQFVSVSTDGQMMFWDSKKLSEPTEVIPLGDGTGRILGGSSMEYNIEAGPAKFLVGTEQGVVLSANLKKKAAGSKGGDANLCVPNDMGPGKHHGPIYSIQRNPTHPSNYMTVGDWGVRFWSEKNKTPIMMTPYSKVYLTAGCWSPTRAGVFYVTRMDGVVDVWDYYQRQSTPTYSHKVSDAALSSISVQGSPQGGGGKLVAVGDVNGTVSLLEVSDNLAQVQPNEKLMMGAMFERESKREENLEKRALALARAAKAASSRKDVPAAEPEVDPRDAAMEETLKKVDADFLAAIHGEVAHGGAGAEESKEGKEAEAAAE